MKIRYVFLLYCLFVSASPSSSLGAAIPTKSLAEGTLHTFTTPDGRSLKAVLKDYNDRTGKIQIEREDGKELWTLPTVFSGSDQEYIQQWITADQFMSPAKFRIKADSSKNKISKNRTEIEYEITLENKTDFPLKDIKIEYRAFILNKGYGGKEDSDRVGGGQLLIDEIPAGGRASQEAQAINLITRFETVSETTGRGGVTTYEQKTDQEQLEGFWVKVYGPKIDGIPVIREWCNPPDTHEDFAWQDKTTSAPIVKPTSEAARQRDTHDYSDKELALLKEAGLQRMSNPVKALELYHEAYERAQAPRAAAGIGYLHISHLEPKNIPLGLEWLEKAANGNDYRACSELARLLATYEEPQYHDLEKAIKYGLQAISIQPNDFYSHRMVATAYAHYDLFNEAVEHQSLAIELYNERKDPSSSYVSRMEETLELYQNNKTE